jgi:hypothetical protein
MNARYISKRCLHAWVHVCFSPNCVSEFLQIFFEDILARRRRAQLKWEGTPIESIFAEQSDLRVTFPQVLCRVFGHVLSKKGMRSTDAFDFFDSSNDGTLQTIEVYRMFKWAGITANPRQILTFIRAVDSDKDMQIDQGEFMAALHLEAGAAAQTSEVADRRNLIPMGAEERSEMEMRFQEEVRCMEAERKERDEFARQIRERQEQHVRAQMLAGSTNCSSEQEKDAKPNPAVSDKSARYRGVHVCVLMSMHVQKSDTYVCMFAYAYMYKYIYTHIYIYI